MKDNKNNLTNPYSLAIVICGAIAAFVGALALLGWAIDYRLFAGAYIDEIPMAPNTAVKFMALGICLAAWSIRPSSRIIIWLGRAVVVIVAVFSFLTLIQYVLGVDWGTDRLLFRTEQTIDQIPLGRPSPIAALAFLAAGASFMLMLLPLRGKEWQQNLVSSLAVAILTLSFVLAVGYLYGTPLLYGGAFIPVALSTSLAFLSLSMGLVLASGRDSWPIKLFSGSSLRAQLMRVFLPLTVIVVVFEGWLISAIIHRQSNINPAVLSSVSAIAILAIAGLIITLLAKDIGESVDRAYEERRQAEKKLSEALQLLETIFEHTHMMVAYLDPRFNFIRVNRAYAEADERDLSFYPGKNHFDLYPNVENQRIFEDVVRTGEPYIAFARAFEYAEHPEWGVSYWDWSLVPIPAKEGKVAGLILTLLNVTEREEAEKKLRQAGAYNRSLIESSLDPLVTIDATGKITDLNAATEFVTGYPRSGLVGTDFSNYFTEPEKAREGYQQAFREGQVRDYSLEIRHKDGPITSVLYNASTYRDESGEVVGVFAAARDVTERKAAEEALRRSNRALKVLSDCNQVLVRSQDESFLLNQISDILVDVGGYRLAWVGLTEEEGRTIRPVAWCGIETGALEKMAIGWAGDARVQGPITKAIEERGPVVCRDIAHNEEFAPWRADAAERGYQSLIVLPLEIDKEVIGSLQVYAAEPEAFNDAEVGLLVEMADDIAYGVKSLRISKQHDLAEKALIASEAKYRNLFEESKDSVFIVTPAGKVVDLNPAGMETMGYSPEELSQVNLLQDLTTGGDGKASLSHELETKGFVKDFELDFRRPDGKEVTVLISASAMRDNDGNVVSYSGIMHDMTEHRRLEQQLFRAQRLESIGRLAGGIAHDFNNFLTAVKGYIDLALTELPKGSPAGDDLIEAGMSAERAVGLTRQLLIFSRRESMNLKPLNLNATVNELMKMLDQLIGERYEIVTDLDDTLARINADAGHIEQVIMNLVVNARDAMEATGGKIFIKTANVFVDEKHARRQDAAPGDYVVLTVRDTGCGMSEETQSHIFEPFFTEKPGAESTGLGLSLVYGITKQHGGWIEVESAPDQGATFRIYFPAIHSVKTIVSDGEKIGGALQGEGERLLVVEDEEQVRKFIVKVLEKNGYEVVEAATAEDALERFDQEEGGFDLVCSDVVLPGEDGVWLAEKVCARKPDMPILLASGYNQPEEQKVISDKGFGFIPKPYSMDELLARIGELIKKT